MAVIPPLPPSLPVSQASVDRVVSQAVATAKDVAYVAVGFAVLGFQQAQVRRRELEKALGCSGRSTTQAK